jgi:hypothetical protein
LANAGHEVVFSDLAAIFVLPGGTGITSFETIEFETNIDRSAFVTRTRSTALAGPDS